MVDVETIARVCHEANRGWCEAHGDTSQWTWNLAHRWQRESAIAGVQFALANLDAPDSAQHDAWMADKVRDGWVYGPVKDAEAKTHPCLVPFDQLPIEQRRKDSLFRAVVRALSGPALPDACTGRVHVYAPKAALCLCGATERYEDQ